MILEAVRFDTARRGPIAIDAADLTGTMAPDLVVANVYGDSLSFLPNLSTPAYSRDCNTNGAPDECDELGHCDHDGDGRVTLADHAAFMDCQAGPGMEPTPADMGCVAVCLAAFDADGDLDVDLVDASVLHRYFDQP